MSRLRSWLRMSWAERRSVLAALLAVAGVRTLLWVLPYRAVVRLVRGTAIPPRRRPPSPPATAERIARDVARVARVVPRATCLVQALAGEWLIVRAGIPVALQFGVVLGERGLEAHAWLECGDRVILGAEEAARFSPMRAP
jgi:hypothetical protein